MYYYAEKSVRLTLRYLLIVFMFSFICSVSIAEEEIEQPAAPEAPASKPEVTAVAEDPSQAFDSIQLLTEVLLKVKNDYVEEKDFQKIIYGAIDGMLTALDPYSGFLDGKSYKVMQEETSGHFGGIGIHIGKRNGMLTVIAPIEDTPAYQAGVQAGDIIEEIDGEKTYGKSLREAIDKLRGAEGDSVKIRLRRRGEEEPMDLVLVRDNIEVPSVKGARIIQDGIGYLRIIQFSEPTAMMLKKDMDMLLEKDLKGLILDLRSNPGGLLNSAIDVSSIFLKKNALVVTTKGRKKIYDKEARAYGSTHLTDFPMVVLVDEGSASASEIVAGALQDNKRAIIVGSQSFGKGSVQTIRPLTADPKTAIRMTTAYYYTPSGRLIHQKGIQPDIEVAVTPKEWRDIRIRRAHIENPAFYDEAEIKQYNSVVDYPLQRALDLVKGLLIFRTDDD